ncbi:M20 family peptidase [Bacillus thuringiensis serovar kurstaki str. YBT-1520]|nr:M20 family peptidase [Bacillus thuringiensis serovar kurstaki str. YBT-1520]
MSRWQSKEQLIQLLSSLVEIPSITGTEAEVILPHFVVEQFI